MSALLKSAESPATRRLSLGGAQPNPAPAAIDPRDAEIAALHAELSRLKEAAGGSAQALEQAHDRGRKAGLAEAEDRARDQLELLRASLADAGKAFAASLGELERLAPALARAALAKLFDRVDDWAPMVTDAIDRQVRALGNAAVIEVRVSPADFAELPPLDHVAFDASLSAGTARIECKLGQLDLDLNAHWARLAEMLDELAA